MTDKFPWQKAAAIAGIAGFALIAAEKFGIFGGVEGGGGSKKGTVTTGIAGTAPEAWDIPQLTERLPELPFDFSVPTKKETSYTYPITPTTFAPFPTLPLLQSGSVPKKLIEIDVSMIQRSQAYKPTRYTSTVGTSYIPREAGAGKKSSIPPPVLEGRTTEQIYSGRW